MSAPGKFVVAARIAMKELLSITTLGAGLVLFLARLSTLGGIHTLLYDSDSLTMPLFARALHAPEGMGWISGPFLGLFPELPTYLLADLLTPTTKSALVVCGFLNVLLLYLAMRLLASMCGMAFTRARTAATVGTLLITLGMAAETFGSSDWRLGWMLFSSTYYVGISTLGVVTLALVTRIIRGHRSPTGIVTLPPVYLSGTLGLISLLATVSNPMFSVIVSVPCCAAIVVFRFARRCSRLVAMVAIGTLGTGTLLGYLLQPKLHMVSGSVNGYIHGDRIWRTARMVGAMIASLVADPFGAFELAMLVGSVLFALIQTVQILLQRKPASQAVRPYSRDSSFESPSMVRSEVGSSINANFAFDEAINVEVGRTEGNPSPRMFVSVFVASWVVLAPFALIITGPGVTRYFGTFAVFPVCVLVANVPLIARRYLGARRKASVAGVALLSGAAVGFFPSAQAAIAVSPPAEIACVSATVPHGSSGVAEFWTARPIDLFNTAGLRVLQSTPTLGISAWISNPAEFKHRDLTFVLTSWDKSGYTQLDASSVAPLGNPSRVTKCGRLDVYEYFPGTPAHSNLNSRFVYP